MLLSLFFGYLLQLIMRATPSVNRDFDMNIVEVLAFLLLDTAGHLVCLVQFGQLVELLRDRALSVVHRGQE